MIPDRLDSDVSEGEMRAPEIDFDRIWSGISGELWATPMSALERAVARLLHSPALARALISTPSLVFSWVLASIAVFAVGGILTVWMKAPIVPLLAPVVAALAVAFSYGAGADPAYEIARTMPTPARMILLVRVVAVVATNVAIGMAVGALAPSLADITTLWLLPMLAISLLALAVALATHSAIVGGIAAIAVWGGIVTRAEIGQGAFSSAVTASTLETWAPAYLMLAVGSAVVVWWMSGDTTGRREMAGWW